jgi:serine/threonine protein kinase
MTWGDNSQSDFTRARLSPGTRLNGIYEIDQPIGLGGMGEIYKGHLVETGDPVAIKMMLHELAENEAAFTLFRKEASALHHIQNDAVVRYYVFTVEPVLRRPYLAMEFVDGRTLSHILHDNGALPFEAVRSLMQRLASGLQSAHQHGIIHRDVSPDNIIIPNGDVARAKIIDFGIARSNQHGTVIGSGFAGKFNYVSPEQLGLFGGNVTARSDIYSLGLVLVQALTGQPIDMGGSHVEVVEKRRRVPELGAIDMRFRPLLEKMLQPDPDRRPDSMTAVAEWSLGSTASGRHKSDRYRSTDGASTQNRKGRVVRPWRRRMAALMLIALTGGGAYYLYDTQTPMAPGQPRPSPDTLQADPAEKSGITPASQPRTNATEKIRSFVERYDGGNCFFLTPVAIGEHAALIEGLGSSDRPFTAFDTEFQRAIGFDPDIRVLQITEKQCPAIAFLAQLRGGNARAPRLDIDQENLRSGDVLNGMVDRYGTRNVDLILVSDTGAVQNVSNLLKSGTDAKTFNIGMRRTEGGAGRQPQLLIAVASSSPVAALRLQQPAEAEQFFANAVSDAARSGKSVSAVARYFMLEK